VVLSPAQLCEGLERFEDCAILVVGDVIMDEFLWGRVNRISPEAPVPVVNVVRESLMLGGAANVVHNIAALGGKALLCGVIGQDRMGREVRRLLGELGLPTHGLLADPERPTTIKTRVVAHSQQVVRVDREDCRPLAEHNTLKMLETIGAEINTCQAVIIADYGKGVVTQQLMDGILEMAREADIMVGVDPKERNFDLYRHVTFITPNNDEAATMAGIAVHDDDSLAQAGRRLLEELHCRLVLITRGQAGMTLFEGNGNVTHVPTEAKKVFDVSGAGDTVISTFTLGLAAGFSPEQSAVLANFAAGIVVAEVGTATVSAAQLKRVLRNSRQS